MGSRFRARIIDIKDDQAQVYFIDYGNKEVVSNSLIRKLPLSLRKMRPSAIRVEIGDFRPNEGINAENLVEAFYKYILEHKFRVTIFENVRIIKFTKRSQYFLYDILFYSPFSVLLAGLSIQF